ncbi:hypothetical protein MKX01_026339 [Papaver californicum]|nr:hypothetical protein MKX01_026339 [Papaver californicum]
MATTSIQGTMTQHMKARIQIWLFEQKILRMTSQIVFDGHTHLILHNAEAANINSITRMSLGKIFWSFYRNLEFRDTGIENRRTEFEMSSSFSTNNPNHNLVEKYVFVTGAEEENIQGRMVLDSFAETHIPQSDSEKESEETDDEEDFGVLNSFRAKSNQQNSEAEKVTEVGDDEFRNHPLVREVCRLIQRRQAWNPDLEGHLRHLLRSLKPLHVWSVLRNQVDERVALNFFYWADRQWRYRHDPEVYYTLLEILSKTKLCQGCRRVLRLMARCRIDMQPKAYSYLMISYNQAGQLRSTMRVLNLMQKSGCVPDLSICNTAILILVLANQMEKALRFLDRMQRVGIVPDVVTFNCLIKGYCNVHQVDDALELMDEMPLKGCNPDKISYYTVMGFFCKEKRIKEVQELLVKMKIDGNLMPDQVTYNNLIHVLSKNGHGDEALDFLKESEEKGNRVDKVGYSAIVDSYCQKGNLGKAKEIVNGMFIKGCLPDVVTYTAVVIRFFQKGEVDQAKKMIKKIYEHGCKPNTVSYTALLNGLCRTGNSSEAREMMNMSEDDWWTPNAITYSVMVTKGFFPTPAEINLLLQSICREGRVAEAKNFMEECLSKGCAVNVVNFTTVIHGFCKEGDLDAALSLVDDMYLKNKQPDVFTYTTLIDAFGKSGRLEEATELTERMLHKGLLPTPVTYRIVIHRYCVNGKVEELLKLLEKLLLRQEFRTVYNQVVEKLCRIGNLKEAYKVLNKVLRTASKTDADTSHLLMESYLEKRLPLSAYKVACRMFNRNLIPDLKLCKKVKERLILDGKQVEAKRLTMRFVERGHLSPQCG